MRIISDIKNFGGLWLEPHKGNTAYNLMNEKCSQYIDGTNNGATIAAIYATKTDDIENFSGLYYGHFYGPDGKNFLGQTSPTAYTLFNNHYYNAVTEYNKGNKAVGYKELGMAIHYLEDLNAPHHASNQTWGISNHTTYEAWVDTVYTNFFILNATSSTYDYMCNSSFITIANDFSSSARATYGTCGSSTFKTSSWNDTKSNLERTQRGVAGLYYRFLKNTKRI